MPVTQGDTASGGLDSARLGEFSIELVRAHAIRITTGRTFENAPVLRRFLEHIVEYSLLGRADELKEYALGVDVFGRGVSFDPRTDTIVRVQARRLRSKLEEYYRTEGREDRIVLELPKGHYVPEFRLADWPADESRASHAVELRVAHDSPDLSLSSVTDPVTAEPGMRATVPAIPDAGASALSPRQSARLLWIGLGSGLLLGAILMVVAGALPFWSADGRGRSSSDAEVGDPVAETVGPDFHRVAVALFENRSADASLDPLGRLATDRVIRILGESPGVEVEPQPLVKAAGTSGDSASLLAATGASALVTGAYYLHEDGLEFQARIVEPASGRLLHGLAPITGLRARPAEVLERLEQRVAGAVAIHFDEFFGGLSVVSHPPTLDAYREYRAGLEIFQTDYARALAHLERALERDPTFLLPLGIMHFAYGNLGRFGESESALARMESQSDRLTAAERLLIEFLRDQREGRAAQALGVLEDLEHLVPGSFLVNSNIVEESLRLNRPKAAVDAYDRRPFAERSLRHSVGTYRHSIVTQALHMLREYDRELEETMRAQEYAPGVLRFLEAEVGALVALGRVGEVGSVIDRSLSTAQTAVPSDTPGRVMEHAVRELRAHGYREESRQLATRAVDWHRSRPSDTAASRAQREGLAGALYLAERWEEAGALFSALAAEKTDEVIYMGYLGQIAARTGDVTNARAISKKLEGVRTHFFGALATHGRARIAALLGERERAIDLLRDSFTQGFPHGLYLHNHPDFEALRDDSAYQELVRPKG